MAGKRDEVTIAEVAEALNISKTTVSRAISGKGRVSEATRARVLDYIGKGRQDAAAPLRTAQQGPTNNLALVIPKHFMRLDLPAGTPAGIPQGGWRDFVPYDAAR